MKLSIILPTIRIEKLEGLYSSINNSFSDKWEIIIVSPYELPKSFTDGKYNIKYFQDWGTPLRCQQIGLIHARGDYIHRAVDDSLYLPNMLNKAFEKLKQDDYKSCVNIKFYEGENVTHRNMADPEFYYLKYHLQTIKLYTPFDYQIMNFYMTSRKLLWELGGWDCQFETIAFGELDLSLRLQFYGAKLVLTDNITLKCEWMPGEEGDHKPMHDAWADDNKIYSEIYNKPECELRSIIDVKNYQNSPERWERRFGK